MHAVTVYTAPRCVQCDATKRALAKAGVEYREVDLTSDDEARNYVLNTLGHSSAPVIEIDGDNHWSGYRPDRIKALTH